MRRREPPLGVAIHVSSGVETDRAGDTPFADKQGRGGGEDGISDAALSNVGDAGSGSADISPCTVEDDGYRTDVLPSDETSVDLLGWSV